MPAESTVRNWVEITDKKVLEMLSSFPRHRQYAILAECMQEARFKTTPPQLHRSHNGSIAMFRVEIPKCHGAAMVSAVEWHLTRLLKEILDEKVRLRRGVPGHMRKIVIPEREDVDA